MYVFASPVLFVAYLIRHLISPISRAAGCRMITDVDHCICFVLLCSSRRKRTTTTNIITSSFFFCLQVMGIGPAFAIPAALKKVGLTVNDIDVFEINEAFASQAVYCVKKLGVPAEKLNPNGGAYVYVLFFVRVLPCLHMC